MSQSLNEMLKAWEDSRQKPASTPLGPRFYDVRKKRSGRPRMKGHSFTPMGEALRAKELGLDMRTAKPLKRNSL